MKEILIAVAVLFGLVLCGTLVFVGYLVWLVNDFKKGMDGDKE